MKIKTSPNVYEPREDTYLLLDVVKRLKANKALEIGIGTGFISLYLARNCREVHGVDINPEVINLAKQNAKINGIRNVKFWISDLFSNVKDTYDLIVFNPPYLPGEPKDELEKSWAGGKNGREIIEKFLRNVRNYLQSNGKFFILVSSFNNPEYLTKKYSLKIVKSTSLFFEKLFVLEGSK